MIETFCTNYMCTVVLNKNCAESYCQGNLLPAEVRQVVQDGESGGQPGGPTGVPGEGRTKDPRNCCQPAGAADTHHHLPHLHKDKGIVVQGWWWSE